MSAEPTAEANAQLNEPEKKILLETSTGIEEEEEEEELSLSPLKIKSVGRGYAELPPPTDREVNAIKYMKETLDIYPDDEDKNWLTDATWLRFARARSADPMASLAMLKACIKWRKEYKPYTVTFDDVSGILRMGTVFHFGYCLEGRPIFYMTPGAKNSYPAEKREQLIVYLMEETARMQYETVTWVFDWSQFGSRGRDEESKKTREKVTKVLQDFYPERLGSLYMVDTPWYFSLLYKIAGLFIDAKTKKKIHIIENKDVVKYVAPEFLLKQYEGGLAEPPVKRMQAHLHTAHASADPSRSGSTPSSVASSPVA